MTRIGPSLVVSGELESDEELLIEGRVLGHVTMRGAPLTIGGGARVEADIRGTRVLVLGTLTGNVTATERIEIQPPASVRGTLSANQVVLLDGARFDGGIDMQRRTIVTKVAQHRAEQGRHAAAAAGQPAPRERKEG